MGPVRVQRCPVRLHAPMARVALGESASASLQSAAPAQLSWQRSGRRGQSRQRFLKRVGNSSVWRTVCWMFRWPRYACRVRLSVPIGDALAASARADR